MNYYVAVPEADWPTLAAVEECIVERGYPITLEGFQPEDAQQPFKALAHSLGLHVRFRDTPVELEFDATKLSPTQPYAYQFKREPDRTIDHGNGWSTNIYVLGVNKKEKTEPANINEDLEKIGAKDVRFEDGDYVMSFSISAYNDMKFATSSYIMASVIYCFNGYGFEFQGGRHGRMEYADELVSAAEFLERMGFSE